MGALGKRVLISGAGIAGPALAWWLNRFGFEPSIVEVAPKFRSGGYMIDFWGKGFDLIERMGLLPEVERAGYHVREVRFVHEDGSRAGGFSTEPFWKATNGRFISLPRGDLARIIWESLPKTVETRFGERIEAFEDNGREVEVTFSGGDCERFDLVIGADGLHSRVRELLFGPEKPFERFLGYAFAAFTIDDYEPRTPDVYVTYGFAGGGAARFAMRGGRTLVLLLWCEDSPSLPHSDEGRRALLRDRFGRRRWECPHMVEALDRAKDLYVDVVSQIHLPHWSRGRVALVGDAAWAPSFLAGEGCGLGIIGGYALAGEIARSAGDPLAFSSYENRLREFMRSKQKMASRFGGFFVPKTRFGVALRNRVVGLLNIGPIAKLALVSGLRDDVDLPDYGQPVGAS